MNARNSFSNKSTVEEIRARFDNDVDRFSNLNEAQAVAVDAPLMLELLAEAAARVNPNAESVLDIGCGAGNFALKILQRVPGFSVTLVDLSRPMLDRAVERIGPETKGKVVAIQEDIREVALKRETFDVALGAAVFHHLRTDDEWESVFAKVFKSLRPGGSFWISDLVEHEDPRIQALFRARYADFLMAQGGTELKKRVFEDIEKEDTPRSLTYQLSLLQRVGFGRVEVIHKNSCFAAFGGIKDPRGH